MTTATLAPKRQTSKSTAPRIVGAAYGVLVYVLFFATFCYAVGFVTNLVVPRSIDGPVAAASGPAALLINLALLGAFGLQHSGMARPAFKVNHFDLFGLRQTWYHWKVQRYPELGFRVRWIFVRHPIQLGFLIAFWGTPHMTVGHLLFAGVCTLYILVALVLEERDLIKAFGARYRAYREQVNMLVPARRYRG